MFAFGCPGVEPTETGSGAGSTEGPGTTSVGGKGGAGATQSASATGGGGDMNTGGMNTGGGGGDCGPDSDVTSDAKNCGKCDNECVHDEFVEQARCVAGRCRPFCVSGRASIDTPVVGGQDDGCERIGRRVFVTADLISIPFPNGVSSADAKCNEIAMTKGLGGQWKAWLSDLQDPVATRFNQSAVAYILMNGDTVADSWSDLTEPPMGQLQSPINITEEGIQFNGGSLVWTGTNGLGLPTGADCGAWQDTNTPGTAGKCDTPSGGWTAGKVPALQCGPGRLYCFEQ